MTTTEPNARSFNIDDVCLDSKVHNILECHEASRCFTAVPNGCAQLYTRKSYASGEATSMLGRTTS
jgi:hypothetical protein